MKPKTKRNEQFGKLYVYEIGYGSYEESSFTQLLHTKQFTPKDIESLVHKIVKELLMSIVVDEEGHGSYAVETPFSHAGYLDRDWQKLEDGKATDMEKYHYHITFQDLHSAIVDKLIKEHGFQHLLFETTYSLFGWGGLFDRQWSNDEDKELKALRDFVQNDPELQAKHKQIIEKSMPHMKQEEKKLYESMEKDGTRLKKVKETK